MHHLPDCSLPHLFAAAAITNYTVIAVPLNGTQGNVTGYWDGVTLDPNDKVCWGVLASGCCLLALAAASSGSGRILPSS